MFRVPFLSLYHVCIELSAKGPVPRDVRVMCAILKSMGVDDFEPKVVNQLLEFTHSTYIA